MVGNIRLLLVLSTGFRYIRLCIAVNITFILGGDSENLISFLKVHISLELPQDGFCLPIYPFRLNLSLDRSEFNKG